MRAIQRLMPQDLRTIPIPIGKPRRAGKENGYILVKTHFLLGQQNMPIQ